MGKNKKPTWLKLLGGGNSRATPPVPNDTQSMVFTDKQLEAYKTFITMAERFADTHSNNEEEYLRQYEFFVSTVVNHMERLDAMSVPMAALREHKPEYPPPYLYVVETDSRATTLDAWGIGDWLTEELGEQ